MRIYIKMKPLISLLIVVFFVSTLHITTSNAQDAPQLIRTLPGHRHGVNSVAFSPDGNTLASASRDAQGDLRLWNPQTGTLQNTINRSGIADIAFSPDGTIVAGASDTVYLYDVNTGIFRNRLGHKGGINNVAFSPNGNIIAGGRRGEIYLWDTHTGNLLDTLTLTEELTWVYSVNFSPDGNTLASANADGTVQLWDVNTGTLRNTLRGHTKWVSSVAYSPDGNTIASGSTDNTARLWDAHTGSLQYTLTEHTNWVYGVAFSPDSTTLASASWDITVRLWDVATGTLQNTLEHPNQVYSVAFSPDGTILACGFEGAGDNVALWRLTPTSGTLAFNPSNVPDQTFTVGTPVNLTLPSATGGTSPYTYSLSPIPPDFQFDAATRVLSGTPTTPKVATPVIYTATDATGQTVSLTFNITITGAPATGITFVPSVIDDLTLTVNTPMEPVYLPLAEGRTPPYTYTLDPIPTGLSFDAGVQQLSGTPTTVGTMAATYTATDATGASASLNFTIEVIEDGPGPGTEPSDVNGDGQVTVIDLAIVALFYGTQVPVGVNLPADVNADGVVDLADLIAVAEGIDAAGGGLNQLSLWEVEAALFAAVEQAAEIEVVAGAPGRAVVSVSVRLSTKNVSAALAAARTDVRKPQKGFAVLEKFLALLTELTTTPEANALLPNYPNPFNPETWIPYHLSKAAEVIVRIYDMRGVAVRELVLGHQAAGVYESRGRAAYWDGRNSSGEPVASGVYFYTLTAGDFTATRKLLIAK